MEVLPRSLTPTPVVAPTATVVVETGMPAFEAGRTVDATEKPTENPRALLGFVAAPGRPSPPVVVAVKPLPPSAHCLRPPAAL